jgi:hypothetical protein
VRLHTKVLDWIVLFMTVLLALSVKFWVWHEEHFSEEVSSGQIGLAVKNDEVEMQQSQVALPSKLTQPQVLVLTGTFCARTVVVLLR